MLGFRPNFQLTIAPATEAFTSVYSPARDFVNDRNTRANPAACTATAMATGTQVIRSFANIGSSKVAEPQRRERGPTIQPGLTLNGHLVIGC